MSVSINHELINSKLLPTQNTWLWPCESQSVWFWIKYLQFLGKSISDYRKSNYWHPINTEYFLIAIQRIIVSFLILYYFIEEKNSKTWCHWFKVSSSSSNARAQGFSSSTFSMEEYHTESQNDLLAGYLNNVYDMI